MSLSTWYPFNQDGKPKINKAGADISSFTERSKCSKFGKSLECYGSPNYYGSSYGYDLELLSSEHWDYKNHSISICAWLYFDYNEISNYLNFTVTDILQSNTKVNQIFDVYKTFAPATGNLLGCNDYEGFALCWETNKLLENSAVPATILNTESFPFEEFYIFGSTRFGASMYITEKYSIKFNEWFHVSLTLDYDQNLMNLYINGDLISSVYANIPQMLQDPYGVYKDPYFYINIPYIYHGRGINVSIPFNVSDLQIHDDCLSDYEVKEISKGLFIHWDCEDEDLKATKNLLSKEVLSLEELYTEGENCRMQIIYVHDGHEYGKSTKLKLHFVSTDQVLYDKQYPNAHGRLYLDTAYVYNFFENLFLDSDMELTLRSENHHCLWISFKYRIHIQGIDNVVYSKENAKLFNPVSIVPFPDFEHLNQLHNNGAVAIALQNKKRVPYEDYFYFEAKMPFPKYLIDDPDVSTDLWNPIEEGYRLLPYLEMVAPFDSEIEIWDIMVEPAYCHDSFPSEYSPKYKPDEGFRTNALIRDVSGFNNNIFSGLNYQETNIQNQCKIRKRPYSNIASDILKTGKIIISNYHPKSIPDDYYTLDLEFQPLDFSNFTIRLFTQNHTPADCVVTANDPYRQFGQIEIYNDDDEIVFHEKNESFILVTDWELNESIRVDSYTALGVINQESPSVGVMFLDHVLTFDGEYLKYYVNGEFIDQAHVDPTKVNLYGIYRIVIKDKLEIQDIRVYMTALSEEDIKELSCVKATVDNKGNLFATEFIEEKEVSPTLPDKYGTVIAEEFSEISNDKDDGDFTQNKIMEIYPSKIAPREIKER